MLQVTAVGNLEADPIHGEVGNLEVTNFTLLVNKKRKDEEYVTPLDFAIWGARAGFAHQALTKGMQLTISGQAHLEMYQSKTGETRGKLVVDVTDFRLPPKPKVETADMPF